MLGLIVNAISTLGGALVTAYIKAKDVTIAGYQAGATMVSAQAEYMTAVLGHPFSPPSLLCYGVTFYYLKVWCYDKIVSFWFTGHSGFTDPLTGDTAYAALIVLTGMFSAGIFRVLKA